MIKQIYRSLLILVIVVLFSSLAIAVKKPSNPPALIWRDADSKEIIFTSNDILEFDWDKQVCILKYNAALDFFAWTRLARGQYRTLSVEDENGIIYQGNWVSMFSSMGFRGPIYSLVLSNPLLSISNGYPSKSSGTKSEDDIRFSPRLKDGLTKSNALKSIDTSQSFEGTKIQWSSTEWKNITNNMKVRLECFKDSFQLGQKARAYIYFASDRNIKADIDSIAMHIKFTANDGRYISETTISNIPVSVLGAGIYPCKFNVWKSTSGLDPNPKLGDGYMTISVILLRKTVKDVSLLHQVDFEPQKVLIEKMTNAAYYSPVYKDQLDH